MTTARGLAFCAPSRFGTVQNTLDGVVCARGQCAETARGQLICSAVDGGAVFVDVKDPANLEFRQTLLEVYVPLYGESWEEFLDSGPVHARIDADRMYTFFMENAAT